MADFIKTKGNISKGQALFGVVATTNITVVPQQALPIFEDIYFNDSSSITKLSSTQIKLSAGKKYKLTGQIAVTLANLVGTLFKFYDITADEYIGAIGRTTPQSDTANNAIETDAVAYIKPDVDTIIELRNVSTANMTILYDGSKIIVEEVESYHDDNIYRFKKGNAIFENSYDETDLYDGNPFKIFATTIFNDSSDIIKLSDTQVKLKAGKKYKLKGDLSTLDSGIQWCIAKFYNVTTSTYIGKELRLVAVTDVTPGTGNSSAEAIVVADVDIIIEFRYIGTYYVTNTYTGSGVVIDEVEAYLPVQSKDRPIISGRIGDAMLHPAGPVVLKFSHFWTNKGGIVYDIVNGTFTVPEKGDYRVTMNPFSHTDAPATQVLIGKNTLVPTAYNNYGQCYSNVTGYNTMCLNSVMPLDAGDYIVFYLETGMLYNLNNDDWYNNFTIERIDI